MQSNAIPTWFNGMIYAEGARVANPFSYEEYELNALELSIYDFIIGAQLLTETAHGAVTPDVYKNLRKAIDWFRRNNPEAYMVLLD